MKKIYPSIFALLFLAACESVAPTNEYFPHSTQLEMFSPSHWKQVAAETATELRQALPAGPTVVHLEPAAPGPFADGFDEFLATELAHRGVSVATEGADRVVKVNVQLVHHRSGPPPTGVTPSSTASEVIVSTALLYRGDRVGGTSKVFYADSDNDLEYLKYRQVNSVPVAGQ